MSSLRPDPFEQRVVHGSAMRHSAPCLVAAPRTADEARALLAVCAERGLSIVPRGHGCSYTGNTLNAGNVVLDTRGLGPDHRVRPFLRPDHRRVRRQHGRHP